MTNQITILSSLLLLQLIIASMLFSTDSHVDSAMTTTSLVDIKDNAVDEIQIIANNDELTLTKHDGRWQLKNHPELPLIQSKVSALTNDLVKSKVTWPVTKTSSSHERFKVANDHFAKKIIFSKNGTKGDEKDSEKYAEQHTVLLGDSPNFKKLYARNEADDNVYSISYSIHQASTDADAWLDKSLLSVDSISQIKHSVINLKKQDDKWQLASPDDKTEQTALDTDSIEELVNQLTRFTVKGIADTSYEPSNQLVVHDEANNEYIYSFAAKDNNYFVKRNDINQWFSLAKPKFEQLANLSMDNFISTNKNYVEEG